MLGPEVLQNVDAVVRAQHPPRLAQAMHRSVTQRKTRRRTSICISLAWLWCAIPHLRDLCIRLILRSMATGFIRPYQSADARLVVACGQ